ncbi:MAG: hypothetical protein IT431_18250 [Phycisphaerales bacterium]|nr:hypothetical protein [Phycisphaerales bacterium]
MGRGRHALSLLVNEGLGTIRLLGPDEAEFTEWRASAVRSGFQTAVVRVDWERGERVTLRRLNGPITVAPCY